MTSILTKNEIEYVFSILEKKYDNNIDTELWYENNYQLLVAILLSAQATDKGVNKITDELFKIIKQPQDAVSLGEEKINNYIKSINYHNTKAKHILSLSQTLIEKFNGIVPSTLEELTSLAGVGRKTANLVMSIAFKKPEIAVDTHVFRVSNRLGLTMATNVLNTEKQLKINIPKQKHRAINNLLIPFGREYCKAIKPKCNNCPFNKICKFHLKQCVENEKK